VDSCDECGFVYESVGSDEVADLLRGFGPKFADRLSAPPEQLYTRPEPEVWSAVEYGCHVRDLFLIQRERLFVALVEDTPNFAPMYRDSRVELARYNSISVAQLIEELAVASRLVADTFAALEPDQWSRLCIYNFPAPTERSMVWLGQHTIHEGTHHLMDVERSLGVARKS
jgi:hypothetical protein